MTLTVAQAFNIAYEKWNEQKRKKEERKKHTLKQQTSSSKNTNADEPLGKFVIFCCWFLNI